jgi:hypothetical protein
MTAKGRNHETVAAPIAGYRFDKHGDYTEAKAFRVFIRTYSPSRRGRLRANLELTPHKALIGAVMTCVCAAWECAADPICWNCSVCRTRLSAPVATFRGAHRAELHEAFSSPHIADCIAELREAFSSPHIADCIAELYRLSVVRTYRIV